MRVLILAGYEDTGGVHIALKRAFDKYPELGIVARTIRSQDNYIHYPADLQGAIPPNLMKHTDVVHVNSDGFDTNVFYTLRGKPVVVHHHGWHFRNDTSGWLKRAPDNAVHVAATPDLVVPEAQWIPNPADIAWLMGFRRSKSDKRMVAHAPTVRSSKGTHKFVAAIKEIQKVYPLDFKMIERKTWLQCLRMKAPAHVLLDQLDYGFGLNAVEAWAIGMAVVSGATAQVEEKLIQNIGYLPYYKVNGDNIYNLLLTLVSDVDMINEYMQIGWQYINDYHDDYKVALKWKAAYEEALS